MEDLVEKNRSFVDKNENFVENGMQLGTSAVLLEDKGCESSSSSDILTAETKSNKEHSDSSSCSTSSCSEDAKETPLDDTKLKKQSSTISGK